MEDWNVINAYAAPDKGLGQDKLELAKILQEAMIEEKLDGLNKKWCKAGDWNDEFDESPSAGIAQLAGGKVVIRKDKDENTGTRWNSDREIDWWCTSDPYDVSNVKACNVKVSDHKGVTVTLRTPNRNWKTGRLQKKPNYKKPEAISPEVWRTHLAEIWAKMANSDNRIKMKKCMVNKDEEADIEE